MSIQRVALLLGLVACTPEPPVTQATAVQDTKQLLLSGRFRGGMDFKCVAASCRGGQVMDFAVVDGQLTVTQRWHVGDWGYVNLSAGQRWADEDSAQPFSTPVSIEADGTFHWTNRGGTAFYHNCRFTSSTQFKCDYDYTRTGASIRFTMYRL